MKKNASTNIKFAFFGTPDRAVYVLDELKKADLLPSLIISQPDRPSGRKLVLTEPPVKIWAKQNNVPVLQPENLDDAHFLTELKNGDFDIFVVVAYGKILKKDLLSIPKHGSINLHASLLPLLRGSCPIETAILSDMSTTGVTVIQMDEKMDHGSIIAQETITISPWPQPADAVAKILVTSGGKLIAKILPQLISGDIKPVEQNHAQATYTKKIVKENGLINLADDGYTNFLKWNAYKGWPNTYFFTRIKNQDIRITITEASYKNGQFVIEKVIPEGKKEIAWSDFKKQNGIV